MRGIVTENLSSIRELVRDKKFAEALAAIEKIDENRLNESESALYCLLFADIKLWLGDYNIQVLLQKALDYFRTSNDNHSYAYAKYVNGRYLVFIGRHYDAREELLESYLNFKRYEDLDSAQRVLNHLAFVQHQSGAIDDAIVNIKTCIEINRRLGRNDNVITLRRNLALIHLTSGHIISALLEYSGIKPMVIKMGANDNYQFNLTYALASAHKGDISNALKIMHDVFYITRDYKREQAIYYEYLGWIYNLDGQYIKAVAALKTGLELSMKIAPEGDLISQTKRLLADAYLGLRKYDEAKATAEEGLKVAEKINERVEIAACYRVLAQVAHHRRQKEQAREWFAKAVDIFKLIQSRYELAATQVLMAESDLYDANGRTALLYMAKEYFEAEEIQPYIDRINTLTVMQPPEPIQQGNNGSGRKNGSPPFIAVHPATKKIVEMAEHIAGCSMTVLLTGPTGSGKDHLAKLIHEYSGRKGEFVLINCAAIPDTIVEAELFGYARGAFTSADRDKAGLVEHADGGTVYLNEIGDCTPAFQAKLLEVIETCQVRRLGTTVTKAVDVRFIAATFHDLKELISDGRFRLDLYHRLNEIPIALPALDERKQDIPELIRLFLMELNPAFDPKSGNSEFRHVCEWLESQAWPGNVRELKAKVGWLYQMSQGDLKAMSEFVAGQDATGITVEELAEREMMRKALEETGWNRSETARRLGITEGAVRRRIAKYNLNG